MERAASPAIELRPDGPGVEVAREGPPARLDFAISTPGEVVLFATLAAPGADWSRRGAECAVLSVDVDGRLASDVIVLSERRFTRGIALGRLSAGPHRISLRFASVSPAGACTIRVAEPLVVHAELGSAEEIALRHAPILYGRSNAELGGPFQNTVTDAPLLAWHGIASASGRRSLEYSVLWTHEDGGTDGPALMARWGRTTDIEWIYRVDVDDRGERIAGSGMFQGPEHEARAFRGAFEADHPILQTCTNNNMVDDAVSDGALRFFLAADRSIDAGRARESVMDLEPWTYRAMAAELFREGRVRPWTRSNGGTLGDPRDYLFVELDGEVRDRTPGGFAIGVRLFGDERLYRSDTGRAELACSARGPLRTAVRLPPGSRPAYVAELYVCRAIRSVADVGVSKVLEAFMLNDAYLPERMEVRLQEPVRLRPERATARLWSRLFDPDLSFEERP